MSGNPVGWFELYVSDMARARAFYEAVFNVSLQNMGMPDMEMWAFGMGNEGYGATGALVKMDGMGPGPGGTLVYFECEDCAVEQARAAASGGNIVQPKFSIGEYGFCALVSDSEGNLIGLHSKA